MKPTIRIDCDTPDQLPEVAELQRITEDGNEVVLLLSKHLTPLAMSRALHQLSRALPECSVIESGGTCAAHGITIDQRTTP